MPTGRKSGSEELEWIAQAHYRAATFGVWVEVVLALTFAVNVWLIARSASSGSGPWVIALLVIFALALALFMVACAMSTLRLFSAANEARDDAHVMKEIEEE